jgi:hypothetical protein
MGAFGGCVKLWIDIGVNQFVRLNSRVQGLPRGASTGRRESAAEFEDPPVPIFGPQRRVTMRILDDLNKCRPAYLSRIAGRPLLLRDIRR